MKQPMFYRRLKCSEHHREISMACERCLKMSCLKCALQDEKCQGRYVAIIILRRKCGSIEANDFTCVTVTSDDTRVKSQ